MAIGCYTPVYLTGSFKGIPFKVEEASSEHGRRGAEGEFPFGETTGFADLGRKIRVYNLQARFDSNAHVAEAALLIAACESVGPGILIHPTRGIILSVSCRRLKVSDRVESAQGVTMLDMEFVEANEWPNGLSLIGTSIGLGLSTVLTAARLAFTTFYVIDSIQAFREAAVIAVAQNQILGVIEQYTAATSDLSGSDSRNRAIYDLTTVATVQDEAAITANVDNAISRGMAAIAQNLTEGDKFEAFRTLANNAASTSLFSSPAAEAENAIYNLVRVSAAAYMAEAILEAQDYRTGQIFIQADIVDTILEGEVEYARNACQNHLHASLTEFRIEVASRLAERAYDSPGLVEYEFGGQVHPLKAAYDIFGDAKRHRELEDLNILGPQGRVGSPVSGVRS